MKYYMKYYMKYIWVILLSIIVLSIICSNILEPYTLNLSTSLNSKGIPHTQKIYNEYTNDMDFESIFNIDEINRERMLWSFSDPFLYTTCSNIDGEENGIKFPCKDYGMVYNEDLLTQTRLATQNEFGRDVCCLPK